jgi:hypothetical protein
LLTQIPLLTVRATASTATTIINLIFIDSVFVIFVLAPFCSFFFLE